MFYTEYKDQSLTQKKYMEKFMIILLDQLTQQCSKITESLQDLLLRFYAHLKSEQNHETAKHQEVVCKQYCQKVISEVTNVFSLLSLYVSTLSTMEVDVAVMAPASNSIISFIDVLCSFTVEIKAVEKSMEKALHPTFVVESSHPYVYELKAPVVISCKGAESFWVTYSAQSKFPPMDFFKAIRVVNVQTQQDLLRISSDTTTHTAIECEAKDEVRIEFDYADVKKLKLEYLLGHPVPDCFGFKLDIVPRFGSELLTLNDYLDQILRACTWLIGRFAYSLVRVKKAEKETDEEKNYKLLLHSKIFSGGFENRFLPLFSKRTIKRLQELTDVTEDKALLALFADGDSDQHPDDRCLFAVLHEKRDAKIDAFLCFLQRNFAKTVVWGNVGGFTAERMVRSAFAPMLKFSNLTADFLALADEFAVEEELGAEIADSKEREQRILTQLRLNPKFEVVQKRWGVASRMRTFY